MKDDTTFGDMVNAGVETVIDQLRHRVNLPAETEALVEAALRQAAKYGVAAAEDMVQALRQRIDGGAA
jgi:phospholipase/lecithinase/hemolysin